MRLFFAMCAAMLMLSSSALWGAGSDVANAVMNRKLSTLRALLQQKANVNAPQLDGTTAMHWAAQLGDQKAADLLIQEGANVSAANRTGVTPLQLAATDGNAAMMEKLIKAGANPNAPLTPEGDTVLMMAARNGKPAAIKTL